MCNIRFFVDKNMKCIRGFALFYVYSIKNAHFCDEIAKM